MKRVKSSEKRYKLVSRSGRYGSRQRHEQLTMAIQARRQAVSKAACLLACLYPQGNSNPRRLREREVS